MTPRDDVHPLVRRVASLDRAGKAALRQSLSFPPGTWPRAFRYVEPFTTTASRWRRTVAYLVAGLMAWSQSDREGAGDLGTACARLRIASDSGSVERRFLALLEADRDALPHHLRQIVALLASHDITPNWSQLLHDLTRWDHDDDRRVQQRWARSYYREAAGEGDGTEPSADNDAQATPTSVAPTTDAGQES
jgi:CRISPR system Cascade subunit CasB